MPLYEECARQSQRLQGEPRRRPCWGRGCLQDGSNFMSTSLGELHCGEVCNHRDKQSITSWCDEEIECSKRQARAAFQFHCRNKTSCRGDDVE